MQRSFCMVTFAVFTFPGRIRFICRNVTRRLFRTSNRTWAAFRNKVRDRRRVRRMNECGQHVHVIRATKQRWNTLTAVTLDSVLFEKNGEILVFKYATFGEVKLIRVGMKCPRETGAFVLTTDMYHVWAVRIDIHSEQGVGIVMRSSHERHLPRCAVTPTVYPPSPCSLHSQHSGDDVVSCWDERIAHSSFKHLTLTCETILLQLPAETDAD